MLRCAHGHASHVSRNAKVALGPRRFHDFPDFPHPLEFELEVFDYHRYAREIQGASGFCPGRDGSFDGIIDQGIWEAWETRVVDELLRTASPGFVLDFGASAGWYSVIALLRGHNVVAYEAEVDTAALLARNLLRAGERGRWSVVNRLVGGDSWRGCDFPVDDSREILLLKADVEGMEFEVLGACRALVEARRIKYMLLEISPCFREGYGDLLAGLTGRGYALYSIPDKTFPDMDAFSADPLLHTLRREIVDPRAYVASIRQQNVLVVRRD